MILSILNLYLEGELDIIRLFLKGNSLAAGRAWVESADGLRSNSKDENDLPIWPEQSHGQSLWL